MLRTYEYTFQKWSIILISLNFFSLPFLQAAEEENLQPESATHFEETIRPTLVQFCGDCHSPSGTDDESTEFLSAITAGDLNQQRSVWGSVASQLQNRTMPPADEPQPTEQQRFDIARWITQTLRSTACDLGDFAGSVTIRRLNRDEYTNTLEDLFGMRFDFDETFPVDGSGGEGFNNNGETLFLPAMLMERYLDAALTVVNSAIITPPLQKKFAAHQFISSVKSTPDQSQLLLYSGTEETFTPVVTYVQAEYQLRFEAKTEQSDSRLIVLVDGIPAKRFSAEQAEEPCQFSLRLNGGIHTLGFRVTGATAARWELEKISLQQKPEKISEDLRKSHDRWIGPKIPSTEKEQEKLAASILSRFASQAFRRPVQPDELEALLIVYRMGMDNEDPFTECIKQAFQAVLIHPHFLFRYEQVPASPGLHPLNDFELATRLSYFLWGHSPDDKLYRLAAAGDLQKPDVLTAQVKRMLADEKSKKLARYFTGQWLGTHEVGARIAPSTSTFKDEFTQELLLDMRAEPVIFFHHLLTENRNLLEFIDADYTFLNQRLARHYGIPDVKQKQFQKVAITNDQRGGLLGFGSVHLLTSYPDRTSPVLRGAWVLDSLLGTPVPSPPPDVPSLATKKKNKEGERMTLREIFAIHRENATCAACHDVIDPIGFGLDNYDVLGRWRTEERETKQPIDPSGTMPSGESFAGPAELKKILLQKKREYLLHLTGKMLGYAIGRSLEDRDSCTINRIVDELEQNDHQAQRLVLGIVLSDQFRQAEAPELVHQHDASPVSTKE